ncbi:hypothetical protein NS2R_18355 [Pseudomonas oryzihabitans]|nr:hypothetical protein NS2R_18355 [Pseudomonas psychrotolerans]
MVWVRLERSLMLVTIGLISMGETLARKAVEKLASITQSAAKLRVRRDAPPAQASIGVEVAVAGFR